MSTAKERALAYLGLTPEVPAAPQPRVLTWLGLIVGSALLIAGLWDLIGVGRWVWGLGQLVVGLLVAQRAVSELRRTSPNRVAPAGSASRSR